MRASKMGKRITAGLLAAALLLPAWTGAGIGRAAAMGGETADGYTFERYAPQGQYDFQTVRDVDAAGDGYVYVADYSNNRIVKLDGNGTELSTWHGDEAEVSFEPRAVTASVTGAVYAADRHAIWEALPGGAFVPKFEADGASYLSGLAMNESDGTLYASDEGLSRLWVATADGSFEAWTTYDDESVAVPFGSLQDVAVDGDGNVYVIEEGYRILVLNAQGDLLRSIEPGYYSLAALSVAADGTIYATDHDDDSTVLKLSADGDVLSAVGGSYGVGELQFNSPYGISVDASGVVYVADTYNDRVQKLDANLAHLASWGGYGGSPGQFYYPQGIAIDDDGYVYVADTGNYRVQKLDPSFGFVQEQGNPADPSSFTPYGLAVDEAGNVFIATEDGAYKYRATDQNIEKLYYGNEVNGVALDDEGNVYLADTVGHRVAKIPADGGDVEFWVGETEEGGLYFRPKGIAVDSKRGIAYVSDSTRIQTFGLDEPTSEDEESSSDEDEVHTIGGTFGHIGGIALDRAGNLYVADSNANRIVKLAPEDGELLAVWGEEGKGASQTQELNGIAVDRDGSVYVTDSTNQRILKMDIRLE